MPEWFASLRQRDTGMVERIVPGTAAWELGHSEHIQRYMFVLQHMPRDARVLDAGCGSGYGAAYLADHGAREVAAVDIAAEAIEMARKHFSRDRVTWMQDDCHTLSRAAEHAPFDLICNLENIEHLREPERFVRRAAALLQPDGVLITSTPNRILANRLRGEPPDAAPRNLHHAREFTAPEFRSLLAQSFAEVTLHYQTYLPEWRTLLSIEPLLSLLWYNPFARLGRWMQRLLRGRHVPARYQELLPRCRFEITASDPGQDLVLVYLAVCRGPRVPR